MIQLYALKCWRFRNLHILICIHCVETESWSSVHCIMKFTFWHFFYLWKQLHRQDVWKLKDIWNSYTKVKLFLGPCFKGILTCPSSGSKMNMLKIRKDCSGIALVPLIPYIKLLSITYEKRWWPFWSTWRWTHDHFSNNVCVACMVDLRILVRKPKGKNHLEDLGIDGRVMLQWILRK
jgi:hypothetical protein